MEKKVDFKRIVDMRKKWIERDLIQKHSFNITREAGIIYDFSIYYPKVVQNETKCI